MACVTAQRAEREAQRQAEEEALKRYAAALERAEKKAREISSRSWRARGNVDRASEVDDESEDE